MDWLQFIAAVVGHLAWPSVVVVLLILFRTHLGLLAERLIELSYGGAKITFEKKLQEGASIIQHAPEAVAPLAEDANWKRSNAVDQIISRYEQVDSILFDIADKLGFDVAEARSVIYTLLHHKIVSKEIANLYQVIKDARNIVVHARVLPSEQDATEYARQALYLLTVLMQVEDKFKRGEIKI